MQVRQIVGVMGCAGLLVGCASGGRKWPEISDASALIAEARSEIDEAERAGADTLAPEALASARQALTDAENRAQGSAHRAAVDARRAAADANFAEAQAERLKAERERTRAEGALATLPGGGPR